MGKEVVDEVGFGDNGGASIAIGAELALVDDISSFLHCYSLIYIFLPFYYKKAVGRNYGTDATKRLDFFGFLCYNDITKTGKRKEVAYDNRICDMLDSRRGLTDRLLGDSESQGILADDALRVRVSGQPRIFDYVPCKHR